MKRILQCYKDGFEKRRTQWPELLSLDVWRESEELRILTHNITNPENILEIGCLTGHLSILLAEKGYNNIVGVEFLKEAYSVACKLNKDNKVQFINGFYPCGIEGKFNTIILFDVLEHVLDINVFLSEIVTNNLSETGNVLIAVPRGKEYFDPGHINFYPDIECLLSLLKFYFKKIESGYICDGKKIFCKCSGGII